MAFSLTSTQQQAPGGIDPTATWAAPVVKPKLPGTGTLAPTSPVGTTAPAPVPATTPQLGTLGNTIISAAGGSPTPAPTPTISPYTGTGAYATSGAPTMTNGTTGAAPGGITTTNPNWEAPQKPQMPLQPSIPPLGAPDPSSGVGSDPTASGITPFTGPPAIENTPPPSVNTAGPSLPPPMPTGPSLPPPMPPGPSGPPSPYTTEFGPGNDLINQQINPYANPRLRETQSAVDASRDALSGGPSRYDLAGDYFNQFAAQSAPQYQADMRAATQMAAANGRLGSGMLSTTYGDLALNRTRDLQNAQNTYLTNALEGTINDRYRTNDALSGLENQQYGQGVQGRSEVRGERGYQYGLSQDAITSAERQRMLEEQLQQGDFGRNQAVLDDMIAMGYANSPGPTYLGASDQVQGAVNTQSGALGDYWSNYLSRQRPTTGV